MGGKFQKKMTLIQQEAPRRRMMLMVAKEIRMVQTANVPPTQPKKRKECYCWPIHILRVNTENQKYECYQLCMCTQHTFGSGVQIVKRYTIEHVLWAENSQPGWKGRELDTHSTKGQVSEQHSTGALPNFAQASLGRLPIGGGFWAGFRGGFGVPQGKKTTVLIAKCGQQVKPFGYTILHNCISHRGMFSSSHIPSRISQVFQTSKKKNAPSSMQPALMSLITHSFLSPELLMFHLPTSVALANLLALSINSPLKGSKKMLIVTVHKIRSIRKHSSKFI